MDTKNQKGQALLEMALVMTMFLMFWIYIQNSVGNQKKTLNKWKIGYDSKIQFKKNTQK